MRQIKLTALFLIFLALSLTWMIGYYMGLDKCQRIMREEEKAAPTAAITIPDAGSVLTINMWDTIRLIPASLCPCADKRIIKQSTDDRGLISVVYREDGEEYAYYYLTRSEYDSIFNIKP